MVAFFAKVLKEKVVCFGSPVIAKTVWLDCPRLGTNACYLSKGIQLARDQPEWSEGGFEGIKDSRRRKLFLTLCSLPDTILCPALRFLFPGGWAIMLPEADPLPTPAVDEMVHEPALGKICDRL